MFEWGGGVVGVFMEEGAEEGRSRGRVGCAERTRRTWLQAWVRCPFTFRCAPIRNVEVRQGSVLEVKSRESAYCCDI